MPGLSIPIWFEATKSTLGFRNGRAPFTAKDFVYMGDFIVALRQQKNPLDKMVFSSFDADIQNVLAEYDNNTDSEPESRFVEALLAGLNSLLEVGNLASEHKAGKLGSFALWVIEISSLCSLLHQWHPAGATRSGEKFYTRKHVRAI